MAHDEYGIYRKPTGGVLAAWLGVAAALFFGAYAFKTRDRLQQAEIELASAREEAGQMRTQLHVQQGELQTLRELRAASAAASATQQVHEVPVAPVAFPLQAAPSSQEAQGVQAVAPIPVAPVVVESAVAAKADSVESAAIAPVVAKEGSGVTQPPRSSAVEEGRLSGEILVYTPNTRKVMLSLGSATSGLLPGSRFSVWRGEEYVTDIRVVAVFSTMSTCEIEGPTPIGLRAGDIAKLSDKPTGT